APMRFSTGTIAVRAHPCYIVPDQTGGRQDMKRRRKPTDIVQYKIRMPAHLHARLEKEAAKYSRTLNDELVRRLGDSLQQAENEAKMAANEAKLAEVEVRIARAQAETDLAGLKERLRQLEAATERSQAVASTLNRLGKWIEEHGEERFGD